MQPQVSHVPRSHGVESLVSQYVSQIPIGEVKAFLCPDISEMLSRLQNSKLAYPVDSRVVVCTWNVIPAHEAILQDILRALAEVALAIWPSWYGQKNTFVGNRHVYFEDTIVNQLKCKELQSTRQELCLPWVKAAVAACEAGKVPILDDFPRAIQFSQLALSIDPDNIIFVIAVNDLHPQQHRLLGLARAAEWFAKETQARVAVLIPTHLTSYEELDSILYGAIQVPLHHHDNGNSTAEEEFNYVIWPIQGKPHPFSPGEQKLAKRLADDPELASLFHFNHSVETVRGNKYLVDLWWPAGRVVIEIDGYRHHGNRFNFCEDRHRDYELLISGCIVLRLPHEDVVRDVEIALEKIRDVVRFRNKQQLNLREV
jgi:very-short-patch-repair endonuclease